MAGMAKQTLPQHVGFIPDGNRRWAVARGYGKHQGYDHGIAPGETLLAQCRELGIPEISIYGFTQDNTRRASVQKHAFTEACIRFAEAAIRQGAALHVVGDDASAQFPELLRPYRQRQAGGIKVNLLVNYGWKWDLDGLQQGRLHSHDVSRLDMVVRWGGGCRLSGFLPVQSVYADLFIVKDYWPDYQPSHFEQALSWYARQDRTLGG